MKSAMGSWLIMGLNVLLLGGSCFLVADIVTRIGAEALEPVPLASAPPDREAAPADARLVALACLPEDLAQVRGDLRLRGHLIGLAKRLLGFEANLAVSFRSCLPERLHHFAVFDLELACNLSTGFGSGFANIDIAVAQQSGNFYHSLFIA